MFPPFTCAGQRWGLANPWCCCLASVARRLISLRWPSMLIEAGYAVLLPEPRGIGASRGPMQGITLHDLAADVAALLQRWINGPATIIGHAFGNRIARTLAADRPELVSAVVLLSSSGKVQPTPEIAEAIRLAQGVDTPRDVRRTTVQQAWFAPGGDVTPGWMAGPSR